MGEGVDGGEIWSTTTFQRGNRTNPWVENGRLKTTRIWRRVVKCMIWYMNSGVEFMGLGVGVGVGCG